MKIIMDFRGYDGVIGPVEQGAQQLAQGVAGAGHDVLLVCRAGRQNEVADLIGRNGRTRFFPVSERSASCPVLSAAQDGAFFRRLAESEKADIVHFFNRGFPFRKSAACVLTVYDSFASLPTRDNASAQMEMRPALGIGMACRLNDMVAATSECARQQLVTRGGVAPGKVRVIREGMRELEGSDAGLAARVLDRFGLGAGFILADGGSDACRNTPRLIRAFSDVVKLNGYKGKLVIIGMDAVRLRREKVELACDAVLDETHMHDRVILAGFETPEERDALIRKADMMVYAPVGGASAVPILEAMSVGVPALASTDGAISEVVGGAAASVDPRDQKAISSEIARILEDPKLRENLSEAGMKRASEFSWSLHCEQYLGLYEEARSRFKRA